MDDTLQAADSQSVPVSIWRRVGRTFLLCAALARPLHWSKNVLVVLGTAIALAHGTVLTGTQVATQAFLALAATCLIASSYYVLNETLDAVSDRSHPEKKHRPVASGDVAPWLALTGFLVIVAASMGLAAAVNKPFFAAAGFLLLMSLLYNVPPIRLKDVPYLDVVSESINSPLRIFLGWIAINPEPWPPVALLLFFWAAGALLMSWKRLRELRVFRDPACAVAYRKSFAHYNPQRLRWAMAGYSAAAFVFASVQMVAWFY